MEAHLITEADLPFSVRLLLYYSGRMPDHMGKWRVISALRHFFSPLQKIPIRVHRDHLTWTIDPTDYVQSQLFWYGTRDKWEIYHLRKLLSPGAVIFDVGANFGYYSLVLAHALQRNCTVYAFEPNPATFERLCDNVSLNGLGGVIHAQRLGLSDCEGEASLSEPSDNSGATILTAGQGIKVTTLDSFALANNVPRVDLIKIDVEGMERFVLRGAERLIGRKPAPVILVEVHPHTLRRAGTSAAELLDDLRRLGFEICELRRQTLTPLRRVPSSNDYINVLCIPQARLC